MTKTEASGPWGAQLSSASRGHCPPCVHRLFEISPVSIRPSSERHATGTATNAAVPGKAMTAAARGSRARRLVDCAKEEESLSPG